MSLIDLYESLASNFFALLWIVQKNKELKWSKTCCQKKKKSLPRFPKEKTKQLAVGEKKKQPKKELKKRPFQQTKKNLHLHLRANFLKNPNKLNSFNWNW